MRDMKHWSRSFALLAVLLGIVGQSAAIASSTGNRGEGTLQTSPSISSKRQSTNFELAQVLGRSGDCRRTTKETPLFERRIPTNIRDTVREGTEVNLLENNGGGIDYIEVQLRRSPRIQGYINTSDLVPCSSSSVQAIPQGTPIPGNCLKITSAKIDFRSGPGFNYPLVDPFSLYVNEEVTITGIEIQDSGGLVWVPVLTRFGTPPGWIVLGIPREGRYNAISCS